ncbi:hypothetical protein LX97_03320 [Nonlabens dokdonensis]|uniref:Uncharacterized protein n=3 Tax=Nonlabens dokdonensis TaxID=328515 RepID=L7WAQ9_NONDD|nr:hypothetical protein [Nonlabens dokdonensis]AGC76951.1 hypothetical protein DDD_1825 [Nonlabens dokdonensis DSW-6]PZX36855.1 hypothetical protein LX97_03320 [Nonlabens dokdonensis]
MVMTIKRGATKKSIKIILENLSQDFKPKGVDVKKFVGKINIPKDALDIQKEFRDEWK